MAEIITVGRRRRWSDEDKRRIVAETSGPDASCSAVAKRHDLHPGQVFIDHKNWLFAGSDRGGARAAAMYSLIESAKLNGLDPQAYLTDIHALLPTHPAKRIVDLLPWHWTPTAIARHSA